MCDLKVNVAALCRWWGKALDPLPYDIAAKLLFLVIKYGDREIATRADKMPGDVLAAIKLCEQLWFKQNPHSAVFHFSPSNL